MAPKRFNCFSAASMIIITLTILATLTTQTQARTFIGVNPWCRTSSNKRLCTRMVRNATTWQEASLNAMLTTLEYSKRLPTMTLLLEPHLKGLEPQTRDSIMGTCKDQFENAVDDMGTSIKAFKENDIGTVKTFLSAAFSSDCEDSLKQFGVENPFKLYLRLLYKEVDNCLAVLLQI